MELPFSAYGEKYLEALRALRDKAITESYYWGQRREFGRVAFGLIMAGWTAEAGGVSILVDSGLRLNNVAMSLRPKTELVVLTNHGKLGIEVMSYLMDLENSGSIDAHRFMTQGGTIKERIRIIRARREEKKLGLTEASEADRLIIYEEMQRGASGCYVTDDFEDDLE